nr:exodeoxyribonuclease VII small subunit [Accumulibacter sp.]
MPPADSERRADVDASAEEGTPIGNLKFEAALGELERIVQNMEEGRLPLDEALAAYQRGSQLLRHCQQQLNDAEQRIQILDNGMLRHFEPNGEAAP